MWFAAAPARGSRTGVDRLRDALLLGVAIPAALGFVGLLAAKWCALLAAALCARNVVIERGRRSPPAPPVTWDQTFAIALPAIALAAAAWPPLTRPLLQGDSLAYHLPNAAAWANTHSVWVTPVRAWWYPGGSELFAAGLYAFCGPVGVGWAGAGPVLLLGLRVAGFGRAAGAPGYAAGAVGALTIGCSTIGLEAGNLGNDVWLGAFFIESLWLMSQGGTRAWPSAALLALLKPTGIFYAVLAFAAARASAATVLAALAPFALWMVRVAILARAPIYPAAGPPRDEAIASTILAHGLDGIRTLAQALVSHPDAGLLFASALAGIALFRDGRLRLAALGSLVFFLVTPYAFSGGTVPALQTGDSLRYAVPFLALGGVGIALLAARRPIPVALLAMAVSVYELFGIEAIFWNDAITHSAPQIIALTAVTFVLLRGRWLRIGAVALLAGLVTYAVVLSATNPARYADDWIRSGAAETRVFEWLAQVRPRAIVAVNLRPGAILLVSPASSVLEATDAANGCALAARFNAPVITTRTDVIDTPDQHVARWSAARACGQVLYEDDGAIVVQVVAKRVLSR